MDTSTLMDAIIEDDEIKGQMGVDMEGQTDMEVEVGKKEGKKNKGGARGQRTKAQKKKKKKKMDKALAIADRMETKVTKLNSKKTKKMSGKSLWGT